MVNKSIKTEVRTNPTMVLMPNLGPKILIPIMVSGTFSTNPNNPIGIPVGQNENIPAVR
jgi:hypothetical protein